MSDVLQWVRERQRVARGDWCRTVAVGDNDLRRVGDEIERLENRLEVYDVSGTVRLDEDCDGIACRDETIRILDEVRVNLKAENARLNLLHDAVTESQREHISELETALYDVLGAKTLPQAFKIAEQALLKA